MNRAFFSFEVLLSLIISAFVIVNVFYFQTKILEADKKQREDLVSKLDLSSSRIILEKNTNEIKNLKYLNDILYLNGEPFLENISFFKIDETKKYYDIEFVYKEKIKQKWLINK